MYGQVCNILDTGLRNIHRSSIFTYSSCAQTCRDYFLYMFHVCLGKYVKHTCLK